MIADNDGMVRALTGILLKEAGFDQTIYARNGSEAFALLKNESADLIISDWSLTEMDGLALLRACKEDPVLRNIPFVMSSARAERSEMLRALEAGADACVVKPFLFSELQNILKKVRVRSQEKT